MGRPCYNLHVDKQGVAFQLWARVESQRLDQGWTGEAMADYIGLPRNTIRRLKLQPTPPAVTTVHTIVEGLNRLGDKITRREAEVLAGLRPPEPTHPGYISVVDAIKLDRYYTPAQRQAMLELAELFARANRHAEPGGEQGDEAEADAEQPGA